MSVTYGQCDARPTVTSPAAGHHRPLTGTKLYCLVTEANVCEQLAQGFYLKEEWLGLNLQCPNHYTTAGHFGIMAGLLKTEFVLGLGSDTGADVRDGDSAWGLSLIHI